MWFNKAYLSTIHASMRPFLLLLHLFAVYAQNKFVDKSSPDSETYLTSEDFEHAKLHLSDEDRIIDDSEMYNSNRFEGDIANAGLSSQNMARFIGSSSGTSVVGVMRNAVRQSYQRWPNARIPYTISTQYTSWSRAKIAEAFEDYAKFTCITFTPKTYEDRDYIHIFPDDGCYSMVGRVGGRQEVSLASGCLEKGIIIHELMHAVGFFHEQSRADRDDYVTILWENIEDGLSDQFDKYSLRVIDHLGAQYDYSSIMHYAATAFSKNGRNTIEPKQAGVIIGQRRGFSETDIYKINQLYKCPSTQTGNLIRPTKIPPSIQQSTKAPQSACEDRLDSCYILSLLGQCEWGFSTRFMRKNCARTCGKCTDESCVDRRSWCEEWANSGMCNSWFHSDYMHRKCARSCGLC